MDKGMLAKSTLLLFAVTVLAGCPGDAPESPPPAAAPPAPPTAPPAAPAAPGVAVAGFSAEMIEEGRQLFAGQGICFTCHGPAGQGTPLGPNLADQSWLWIEDPSQDLHTKLTLLIRTGIAQPREYPAPMPPASGAGLNEDQIQAVAAYVVALNVQ
jgi:mono/diheme cytochrome c family protein